MRPIPPALKKEIAGCKRLKTCWKCPSENIEINHTFIYQGRQINELWALSSLCKPHHTGKGGFHANRAVKEEIEYLCLKNADLLYLMFKYPKFNWQQLYKYLSTKYAQN